MQVRDMVQALTNQGHLVTYYIRPDGGLRITSIDGQRFSISGNAGNDAARKMLGTSLTAQQKSQRATAAVEAAKGHKVSPMKPKLTGKEKKTIKKLNRLLKKYKKKAIGMEQARQARGRKSSAKDFLKSLTAQAKRLLDIAYTGNIEWLEEWLDTRGLMPLVVEWLENNKEKGLVSDSALVQVQELTYKLFGNQMTEAEATEQALEFLNEGASRIKASVKGYWAGMRNED